MGKEGVAAVGLFELCNPHLLATDVLQVSNIVIAIVSNVVIAIVSKVVSSSRAKYFMTVLFIGWLVWVIPLGSPPFSSSFPVLQSLLVVLKPRPPPTERGEMLELVRNHLSPKEQRKRNRQGDLKQSGKRGSDLLKRRDGDLLEPTSDGGVKDLSLDDQKSAEEKLKERLKAKFSDRGGDQQDSEAKRAKISWP